MPDLRRIGNHKSNRPLVVREVQKWGGKISIEQMKAKPKVSLLPKGTLAESLELQRLEWREKRGLALRDCEAQRLAYLRRKGVKA